MIRSDHRNPGSIRTPASPLMTPDDNGFVPLFHLSLWGGAAAACLLLVAIATWSETGRSRLTAAYAALTGIPDTAERQAAARERELEDARRVTAMIRNLTGDRDQLLARMTALERNYEDVTGSIGKLANAAKPPVAELSETPPPAVMPVAGAPAANAPTASASAGGAPAVSAPGASPAAAPAPVAAVPEPQGPGSTKAEFGIDIGGGPTLVAVRTVWDRAVRNHGVLLDGLRPLIAVRDGRAGQVELRLVAGPISNAATAAKLCAALAGAGLSCQPTMFEGQRLALR